MHDAILLCLLGMCTVCAGSSWHRAGVESPAYTLALGG